MAENNIVMIVEDNPKIVNMNRRLLEKEGCIVLAAKTLKEARGHLSVADPDVVVLDIGLPDGSGLDFLSELRETCNAPVLFLTAMSKREDVIAGLAAGGNDYITKPYDIDEFRLRVMGMLRLVNNTGTNETSPQEDLGLSPREDEIFKMLLTDMPRKQIPMILKISNETVNGHVKNIYRKLKIQSRVELFTRYGKK